MQPSTGVGASDTLDSRCPACVFHAYARSALSRGASLCLGKRPEFGVSPDKMLRFFVNRNSSLRSERMIRHDWLIIGLKLLGVYFAVLGLSGLWGTIVVLIAASSHHGGTTGGATVS